MENGSRVLVALVLTVASGVMLGGCQKKEEAPPPEVVRPVKVMVLGEAGLGAQRTFPGKVRAAQRVDLAFQVAGPLIELPIKEGQLLEKDDLVGRIDPRDFKSNLKAAQAEYDKAKANFARAKTLVKDGFISQSEYDRLKAKRDVDAAQLEKRKKALDDTHMRAPFGGVVARRYVQNFEEVRAKQPIISLQDNSTLELVVDVPERLVVAIRGEGRLATLTAKFETLPGRRFDLIIKEFATEADPKTQTFRYVLVMPRPEGLNILPGMTALVSATRPDISPAGTATVFSIPAIAVVADEAGAAGVWVVDPDTSKVMRRAVQTGKLTGDAEIQVLEGLQAGDTIAVAGVSQLREGMTVRPVTGIKY
ncbi:MAG: efflux RND transporter periplasmic adaptor subunit [Pseudomonadota bacterium]|nr:MAG: efflux RND transporter periplasmic adaptor subunit [Pseudomonadota bacterium]